MYYGFRYYSPELGRWTARDPIGSQGGNNLFSALANNMVRAVDYLGLIDTGALDALGEMAAQNAYRLTCESSDEVPKQVEYCGSICRHMTTGAMQTTGPASDASDSDPQSSCKPPPCPNDGEWQTVGVYHSHPGDVPTSYNDYVSSNLPVGNTGYVGTGSGTYILGKGLDPNGSGKPVPIGCKCNNNGTRSAHPPLNTDDTLTPSAGIIPGTQIPVIPYGR